VPNYNKEYEQEINLIYIGSSACIYCNVKELYVVVDSIKYLVSKNSENMGVGFSAIGISVDWIPTRGINHLKKVGKFDEIIVGNNWTNNGIIKYVSEMGNEASTPQLILSLRTYTHLKKFNVASEKIILSKKGTAQIIKWYKSGVPLPNKFKLELKNYGS